MRVFVGQHTANTFSTGDLGLLLSARSGIHRGAGGKNPARLENPKPGITYRLLLSAHGLPKRTIQRGDPYQWQVEQTARALVDRLGIK